MKKLLIIGGLSTALEIYETASCFYADSFEEIYLVVENNSFYNFPYKYLFDKDLNSFLDNNDCEYIISFSNQKLRKKFEALMDSKDVSPVNICNPNSFISPSSEMGLGNYIAFGVAISSNTKIGNHNVINLNVTIGHDTTISNHCIFNPGASIGGNVSVGNSNLIGSNSFVHQNMKIGNHCVIDALTYIDRDIDDNKICSSKNLRVLNRVVY